MDKVLLEARRLHALGAAVHWLLPKSKRPVESGWTTGPRHSWEYLAKTYRPGMNLGVRLGEASKIKGHFLGVLDVDVKSSHGKHTKEVQAELQRLLGGHKLPMVKSGRGNGSRHYYFLTKRPLTPCKLRQSLEMVKVPMPSVLPSKRDLKALTRAEIEAGLRMRPAYEFATMGEGQQVVLPPSTHPDSGKPYVWQAEFNPALAMGFDESVLQKPVATSTETGSSIYPGFEVEPVDLGWLPVSPTIRAMILTGEGAADRSAALLPIAASLFKAGLSTNEVLTVLTDPTTYIGGVGYDHAQTKDRGRAAAWVWKYSVAKVASEQSPVNIFNAPIEAAKEVAASVREANQKAFDDEYDWRDDLSKTKGDGIQPTLLNTITILKNMAPDFVKRDLFAARDSYAVKAPWGGAVDEALDDDDIRKIRLWLSGKFGVEPAKQVVSDAVTLMAIENGFDPVVDWLEGLAPWDEVPRLDGWLKKNFEGEGDDEYLGQVFRKWMCAMVIRAFKPGVKFDWMPIFEGAQGVGKSSFGRILCGDNYFTDWLPDLTNKDAALALRGMWAVEMGELASFKKNEIEAVKAFITRTVDRVRPPYGEKMVEIKRRCVFFGTTNLEKYLRDDTGNRRFKPCKVGQLDFDALRAEREQLFAEALWLYRSGFETERTLDLDETARAFEREIHHQKMVEDDATVMHDLLHDFWVAEHLKPQAERFNFFKFKIHELFGEGVVGPMRKFKLDNRNIQLAAKALKKLGAEKRFIKGFVFWKWEEKEGKGG